MRTIIAFILGVAGTVLGFSLVNFGKLQILIAMGKEIFLLYWSLLIYIVAFIFLYFPTLRIAMIYCPGTKNVMRPVNFLFFVFGVCLYPLFLFIDNQLRSRNLFYSDYVPLGGTIIVITILIAYAGSLLLTIGLASIWQKFQPFKKK